MSFSDATIAIVVLSLVGCSKKEEPDCAVDGVEMLWTDRSDTFIWVKNELATDFKIRSISAKIESKRLISDSAENLPSDLNYEVVALDADGLPIGPDRVRLIYAGFTTRIDCQVIWNTPDDSPPMLAVVKASFVIHTFEGKDLSTEPQVFILESKKDGVLHKYLETPSNKERLVEIVTALEGNKSYAVRHVLGLPVPEPLD